MHPRVKVLVRNSKLPAIRQLTTSSVLCKKSPKTRDPSKRNLQGEALALRLEQRAKDIKRQEPYKLAVAQVISSFSAEIDEEERKKKDRLGEQMKQQEAEKVQEARNMAILAKSNDDLRRQRELRKLHEQEAADRQRQEKQRLQAEQVAEQQSRNTQLVLRAIEESKDFVTPETLESKIQHVLENEVNYNYAITADGKKIKSKKPPGNLDGWKQPSPHAFVLGGILPGSAEWNMIFKEHQAGFLSRRTGSSTKDA